MHATGLRHQDAATLPPIQATIVVGEDDVGVRISDQGGQIESRLTIDCRICMWQEEVFLQHPSNRLQIYSRSLTYAMRREWTMTGLERCERQAQEV